MKIKPLILLIFCMMLPLYSQFAPLETGFTGRDIGINLNHSSDLAGILSRLQMQHSVSMTAGSSDLGSQSSMAYQNNFFLPLSQKIRFSGSVSLVQPTFSGGIYSQIPNSNQTQVYYDTRLEFDLGKNTKLNIGLSNKPTYYNYYSPYGAFYPWKISK